MENKLKSKPGMETVVGKLLRYGVLLSCIITVFGGIIYLFQQAGTIPNYAPNLENINNFEGTAMYLRSLATILPEVMVFDGAAIVQLGVIVLIATPVFRVALSLVVFLYEKDCLYVVITLIVLSIIMINMFFGIH